jgi:tRNA pseudouridine38/39 synthase
MAGTGDDARPDYTTWSNSSLIDRISELERQLHSQTAQYNAPTIAAPEVAPHAPISIDVHEPAIPLAEPAIQPSKKRALSPEADITHTPAPSRGTKQDRGFDPSKYSTRYIALKFAYLGQRYNGLEHTNGNATPLPTIEEVLWKAMRRTRLITPETSSEDEPNDVEPRVMRPYSIYWDGCEYSKAGRTDRGVSAFGQVVGVRVRSARPKPKPKATTEQEADAMQIEESSVSNDWDDVADELNYIQLLNRVLPEDIRVLAWCPNPPPGFDARFSCRERRYRYFFTQPAFSPTPGSFGFEDRRGKGTGPRSKFREGWLDIEAMREAAKHFEGTHDFRNFCKLDTSKQIENFERIIYRSDIEFVNPKSNPLGYIGRPGFQKMEDDVLDMDMSMEASENPSTSTPQVYSFTLHGSAFLWHQVRHMVAILFLVGQGLESPSIVAELLDIAKNPRKPTYEMASDAPLVLWDCIFPDESSGSREDSLNWVYAGDPRLNKTQSAKGDSKFGMKGVVDELWSVWRHRKIEEILAGALLDLTVSQGDQTHVQHLEGKQGTSKKQSRGVKVWLGADEARAGGKYVPVSEKTKTETVEVQNAKWLVSKERKTAVKEKEAASKTQSA